MAIDPTGLLIYSPWLLVVIPMIPIEKREQFKHGLLELNPKASPPSEVILSDAHRVARLDEVKVFYDEQIREQNPQLRPWDKLDQGARQGVAYLMVMNAHDGKRRAVLPEYGSPRTPGTQSAGTPGRSCARSFARSTPWGGSRLGVESARKGTWAGVKLRVA